MLLAIMALACSAASPPSPECYRLRESTVAVTIEEIPADLRERYPEFFAVVMDPSNFSDPDLLTLRDDLEREPISRTNYDSLNSIALAYFAVNLRAETERGGENYLRNSFRAAKLIAVPWRAYGTTPNPSLRSAILDFFEDIASGAKRQSRRTAARVGRIVSSLEKEEEDPERRARIADLARRLSAQRPGTP